MVKERNEHSGNYTNKKHIEWAIKIVTGILVIISYTISIFKELKELFILTTFASLIGVVIVLWNKFNKEKKLRESSEEASKKQLKRLENDLQEKEKEIKKLRKDTCKDCKKVYFYGADKSLSLSESLDKCFSLIDGISDKEGEVYYLDECIFIDFSLRGEGEECYLINLIGGLIYFPVDKWKKSKGDEVLLYRQLCSNRKIHFDLVKLL